MPELPEVEAARVLVERHCAGHAISAVGAKEGGGGPRDGQFDDIVVCEGVAEAELVEALSGRALTAVRRKGKQLWFELGGAGKDALFHFGMTGAFVVKGITPLKYQEFRVHDEVWPPKFCKLELTFANGARLAFTDPRRLGRIRLRDDPRAEPPISTLAPDPVTEPADLAAFSAALGRTAAPIKAVLLDQERAVSGVGNWLADDVLYLAKIHPAAVSKRLGAEQVAALLRAVRRVCELACKVGADSSRFPKEWLFHVRWGRASKPGTSMKLEDGRRVAFSTVAGRTTAFVPEEQGRTPRYTGAAEPAAAGGDDDDDDDSSADGGEEEEQGQGAGAKRKRGAKASPRQSKPKAKPKKQKKSSPKKKQGKQRKQRKKKR